MEGTALSAILTVPVYVVASTGWPNPNILILLTKLANRTLPLNDKLSTTAIDINTNTTTTNLVIILSQLSQISQISQISPQPID